MGKWSKELKTDKDIIKAFVEIIMYFLVILLFLSFLVSCVTGK